MTAPPRPRRCGLAAVAAAGALLSALAACGGAARVAIDGAYVVQSTQDRAGTVPLVEGRAGLLRVFLRADGPGAASPVVRAELRDEADAVLRRWDAADGTPPAAVPTEVDEGALGASWNFAVDGGDLQPGRHLVVEAAGPGVAARLRVPANGSLDVRRIAKVEVTLVPVVQAPPGAEALAPLVAGTEPGGGERAPSSWLERARRIHPMAEVDVQVGAPFTTDLALGEDGSNWPAVLAALEQKRLLDGSARSYLGVVHVGYLSGPTGLAYAPAVRQPTSALAWDTGTTPEKPSYQKVAAHEIGHWLGLLHAPCGMPPPSGVDPSWPTDAAHAGGHIGVFGWDPLDGSVKDPATTFDLMGYCGSIATTWTSDHDYRRALRDLSVDAAPAAAARQPCLVVSGRLGAEGVTLDPAFVAETVPSLPAAGDHALDLLDGEGRRLASVPFTPVEVAAERAGDAAERHFAMAVPLPGPAAAALSGLAVRQGGRELHRRLAPASAPRGRAPSLAGRVISWDARAHGAAAVRDARTGETLAILRSGAGAVPEGRAVEVILSDGIRSERHVLGAR